MMKFRLSWPLGPYGLAEDQDVHALKTALNQFGYYTPPSETRIEGNREPALFNALGAFQRDKGLSETAHLMPFDKTVDALNQALINRDNAGRYIWRTVKDARVRDEHAARDGQVFLWGDPPDGGHPGEDHNCRCWAEPIVEKRQNLNICNALVEAHNAAKRRYEELGKEIDQTNKGIQDRIDRINSLNEQIWDIQIASPGGPIQGRLKPWSMAADLIDAAAKINRAEEIRKEIENIEAEIRFLEDKKERLQKEREEAYKHILDLEEEFRLRCPKHYD